MTVKSLDDLDRMDVLCEALADSFSEASAQEIDQAAIGAGLNPDALTSEITCTIENALTQSLRRKLIEAGKIARREMSAHRPDLTDLTREQLIAELKLITANEDNAGEMLTMAARAGRGSIPVEELRSLIEDFYSISKPRVDDD